MNGNPFCSFGTVFCVALKLCDISPRNKPHRGESQKIHHCKQRISSLFSLRSSPRFRRRNCDLRLDARPRAGCVFALHRGPRWCVCGVFHRVILRGVVESGYQLITPRYCLRICEPVLDYFASESLDRPAKMICVGGVFADD